MDILNYVFSNLTFQIVLGATLVLLVPSLVILVLKKKHGGLATIWFIALLAMSIALPVSAYFADRFWMHLGLAALLFLLIGLGLVFAVVINLVPNESSALGFIGPINFAIISTIGVIIAHLIFQ